MYDMTIRLRTDSDKCLYQQIYEHIRQEIREGKLLAGERLPSTRSLAEYLQVARSTVDYAYDQLLSEDISRHDLIRAILSAVWKGYLPWNRGKRTNRSRTLQEKNLFRKRDALIFLLMVLI